MSLMLRSPSDAWATSHEGRIAHLADRREVAQRAERHRLEDMRADDQRAVEAHQQRVAVRLKALLDKEKSPSRARIAEAFEGHLCRCGTQPRVLRAVARAAAWPRE
jgi:hypothetical protein